MAAQSVAVVTQKLVSKAQGSEEGKEVAWATSRTVRNLYSHTCLVMSWVAILPEENMEGQVRGRDGACGYCERERENYFLSGVYVNLALPLHIVTPSHHHFLTPSPSHFVNIILSF